MPRLRKYAETPQARMRLVALSATLLATLPAAINAAHAQTPAFIPDGSYLYSGPDPSYPLVGSLQPGTQVATFGCLSGWGWCDVAVGPLRGWVPGQNIQLPYQGGMGSPMTYGAMMGLPLISFAFGSYWNNHYRSQPWFSDRDRWGGGGWDNRGGQGSGRGNMGGMGGMGGMGQHSEFRSGYQQGGGMGPGSRGGDQGRPQGGNDRGEQGGRGPGQGGDRQGGGGQGPGGHGPG
ncbi:SH3 domain-containing protein [Acetobacter sacchari]|nr:SH3 domain-containing protein [Acetobacter sacchari]